MSSTTTSLRRSLLALGFCALAAQASEPASDERRPGTPSLFAPSVDADFYDDGRPSAAKIELGRALFSDPRLSAARDFACVGGLFPGRSLQAGTHGGRAVGALLRHRKDDAQGGGDAAPGPAEAAGA